MVQFEEFIGRPLETFLNTSISLMANKIKPLAKIILVSLRLTAKAAATGAAIQKKMFESGMTTLIISNNEMDDIMKIYNYLEKSGLLIKHVSEIIEKEAKEQKLVKLVASFLGNMSPGKRSI